MSDVDLDSLNTTELATIAAELNPEAHRGLPREVLLWIVQGKDIELPPRVINKKRLKIMRYINDNWNAVQYQVNCPAKSQDPFACFRCSDLQATACTLENSTKFLADD